MYVPMYLNKNSKFWSNILSDEFKVLFNDFRKDTFKNCKLVDDFLKMCVFV